MRRVIAALLLTSFVAGSIAGEQREPSRTLMILLDAVPFATMKRLASAPSAGSASGLFGGFSPPVPLISTFPSSTSIALGGILNRHGLDLSPGYEARFFDWDQRRRRGGGPLSYFNVKFPWRSFFDWNRKGPVRNALHAARPVRAAIKELRNALAAFEASSKTVFSVYIADTDTTAHLFGPTGLDPILVALDEELRQLQARHGGGLNIVLFSDHGLAGGEPLSNVLPAIRQRIADRGWRQAERLHGDDDVVLTPYGLVSSFEAYAEPSLVPAVASALAGVEGVDLCVSTTAAGWRVDAMDYSIDFERRTFPDRAEWRWQIHGDVGGGLAAVLAAAGASESWVSDRGLMASTLGAAYPDPLYRLAGAFAHVQNPASVVCSVADGFMFGARGTERSARWTKGALRWTHGALGRDASLGFLMVDSARSSPGMAVRYDLALAPMLATEKVVGGSQ